jgi:hypothetical protein
MIAVRRATAFVARSRLTAIGNDGRREAAVQLGRHERLTAIKAALE